MTCQRKELGIYLVIPKYSWFRSRINDFRNCFEWMWKWVCLLWHSTALKWIKQLKSLRMDDSEMCITDCDYHSWWCIGDARSKIFRNSEPARWKPAYSENGTSPVKINLALIITRHLKLWKNNWIDSMIFSIWCTFQAIVGVRRQHLSSTTQAGETLVKANQDFIVSAARTKQELHSIVDGTRSLYSFLSHVIGFCCRTVNHISKSSIWTHTTWHSFSAVNCKYWFH